MNRCFQDVMGAFHACVPVWCLTPPGKSESIRFYDTPAVDSTGRHLAVTQYARDDRLPVPGDPATVVVRDLETGEDLVKEATTAWDTQLGAQTQWHPTRPEVFFNVMNGRGFPHAVSLHLHTRERRVYPWTVYMLSPCGRFAVSPDLRRIGLTQAGYGVIVENPDSFRNSRCPEDDGVFITDLESGTCHLAASVRRLVESSGIKVPDGGSCHVFHVKWSPMHDRIMVVLRWVSNNGGKPRRWVLACNKDGSGINCLVDDSLWELGGHHPNWFPSGERVVMNLRPDPSGPLRFCEIADANPARIRPMTGLAGSGHPTIHVSGRWLLTDAYLREHLAHEGHSPLRLVDLQAGVEKILAAVPSKPAFAGPAQEWRVDLHPAWHSTWDRITFNGWHQGRRAVFLADLKAVLG